MSADFNYPQISRLRRFRFKVEADQGRTYRRVGVWAYRREYVSVYPRGKVGCGVYSLRMDGTYGTDATNMMRLNSLERRHADTPTRPYAFS